MGVRRLLVVGGAGSLEVASGVVLLDTPQFPVAGQPIARAHAEALPIYRDTDDLEWTYVSPAALIGPGERTGHFRVGGDTMLIGDDGKSRISFPDYAIAFVDELERGTAVRRRISVAY